MFDTVQDCNIKSLAGCYVNGDRQKVKTFRAPFYQLPEEEKYKYLEIFRKTLSGTPGKNLLDMHFTDPEGKNPEAGCGILNRLRKTELQEDALLEGFYDRVIETYSHVGNYLILLICQAYDVPGITEDGLELEDASDEVFSYILCCICPMKLTRPGLGFDDEIGEIHTLRQIFAVELPETGFLFPAFNERSSDESAMLYSCKAADFMQDQFMEKLLGVSPTLPARQQKEGFTEFVQDVLEEETGFETILSIQENLKEAVTNKKNMSDGKTVFLDKEEVRDVFEKSGVSQEKLSSFDRKFDRKFEVKSEDNGHVETKLFADNVAPVRNIEVRNKNMVLRVKSSHTDLFETRVIDGRKCLVIELTDDLTVNGIPVGVPDRES